MQVRIPAPLARGARQARAWGARIWGWVPLNSAGLVLVALLPLAVWLLGVRQLDMVVLMGGAGALTVLVLMAILVILGALVLRWRLARQPLGTALSLQAGSWTPSGFQVAFPPFVPFLNVQWSWDLPSEVEVPRQGWALGERVLLRRRALVQGLTRSFQVSDFLGLCKLRWSQVFPHPVKVLPDAGRLSLLPLQIRLASGEDISDPRGDPQGDRVDMRQYTRGDSPRTILWKVYARTRRLMVRVPERALAARPRVCAYLVTGCEDEPAAGLARVVLEKGLLGQGWRFGADGTEGHDGSPEAALSRLAASGGRGLEGTGLLEFLQEAAREGYSQAVVFLPARLGDKQIQVTRALAQSPLPASLFVALDGASQPRPSRWSRWLLKPEPSRSTPELIQELAATWARHPGEVLLVDRQAGVLVGDLRHLRKGAAS